MHLKQLQEKVPLPQGVSASLKGFHLTVKGPKGELTRELASKSVQITVEGNTVLLLSKNTTKNQKMLLRTAQAHVKSMTKGVTEGHHYKLKICSGHFPMSVAIKDGVLEVKNFIGEAVPRRLKLKTGADVKVQGQEITVDSVNKELAGNQASAIELLTRRPGFDTRVFQDGIYIIEKDGKHV